MTWALYDRFQPPPVIEITTEGEITTEPQAQRTQNQTGSMERFQRGIFCSCILCVSVTLW